MPLVTMSDLKAQLDIESDETSHDQELQKYPDAATAVVERFRGEVINPRSVTFYRRIYRPRRTFVVNNVPIQSLTSVTDLDSDVTWDISKIHIESDVGAVSAMHGDYFVGYLEVVYQAGYKDFPDDYRLAGLIIAQHLWETQRGMGSGPGLGELETTMQAGGTASRGFAIPNRALELLGGKVPGLA